MAEYSAKVGGDLVQVLMPLRPWGGQPTIAELMEFYTQVASASPLPVTCYHNPGPGADPPQDAFVKISEIDNIRYFKESSRDITKISRLIEQIDLAGRGHYFTTMQPLLVTLMLGGSGATMPPPGTRIGSQIVKAFRAGDLERARFWARCYALFPGQVGCLRLAAGDEVGNEAFRRRYRQSLPALRAGEPARSRADRPIFASSRLDRRSGSDASSFARCSRHTPAGRHIPALANQNKA